jgi:O-antigen ligase
MALQRLVGDSGEDVRTALLPLFTQIARDFLPLGSGFGSFDPVFRTYEPFSNLGPAYVNHVHNDYVEVVLEAGLLGAALLAIFLIWFVIRAFRLWTAQVGRHDQALILGRAGSIIVLLLLASSAVDYPLRTPLLSVVFTIAAIWMVPARGAAGDAKTKLGSNRPIG